MLIKMNCANGGGGGGAASGSGTATAQQEFTISTGLNAISRFVIITCVNGTYTTFAETAFDTDAYSNKQIGYGNYAGSNYGGMTDVPTTGKVAQGVPSTIKSIGYNGVAGDVRVGFSDQGNGSYTWFAE